MQTRRFPSGSVVFTAVRAVPDLSPTAPFFQQAAELGLSHTAALRLVVSAAAVRAGRPALALVAPDRVDRSTLAPEFVSVSPSVFQALRLVWCPVFRGSSIKSIEP